jgi:hypothetical protein
VSVVLNLVATVVVKLFRSVVLAFKLIRLDKVAVSAFCNKYAVSVIFNLVATVFVKLFKFEADVIVDEVHAGLDIRKKLIYSIETDSVSTKEIKFILQF